MRYDTEIYFQKLVQGSYNEDTGNYEDDTYEETKAMASIVNTKTETMMKVYGVIKQGSVTISIQNKYNDSYNYIRIGEKKYQVDYYRTLKTKQSFVLSEVQ